MLKERLEIGFEESIEIRVVLLVAAAQKGGCDGGVEDAERSLKGVADVDVRVGEVEHDLLVSQAHASGVASARIHRR